MRKELGVQMIYFLIRNNTSHRTLEVIEDDWSEIEIKYLGINDT